MSPREQYAPCKNCVPPERHLGCHQDCPRYVEWKKQNDERREDIYRKKYNDLTLRNFTIDGCNKAKKKRKT